VLSACHAASRVQAARNRLGGDGRTPTLLIVKTPKLLQVTLVTDHVGVDRDAKDYSKQREREAEKKVEWFACDPQHALHM